MKRKVSKRRLRGTTFLLSLLGLALIAMACGEDDPTKITIATSTELETPQVVFALTSGIFEDNGLDVDIIQFVSGRDAMTALLGGQADFAVMAELPATSGAMTGQDFRILAELSGLFMHQQVITLQGSGINSFADLEGKNIGLLMGTSSQYELQIALESVGLTSDDVNMISLAPPAQAGALDNGDVDAVVSFDSMLAGTKELLGDRYAEIPNDLYHLRFVFSAGGSMIEDDATSEKVLRALLEAEEAIDADPAKAKADIVAWDASLSLPRADEVFSTYVYRIELSNTLIPQMVDEGEYLRDVQGIEGSPTASLFRSYINSGPLSEVASDRVNL